MPSVTPLNKKPLIKKRTKKFRRQQSDQFMRVPESWRKPRGIDGRTRRRFRGTIPQPKIGFGSNKITRHILPNGFRKFRVFNVADLELLLLHNRTHCAEIASKVGTEKRQAILERAAQLNVKVTNAKSVNMGDDDGEEEAEE